MEKKIAKLLIDKGYQTFNARRPKVVEFTDEHEANLLINNFEIYPHAYVIGCILDRRISAERAWLAPYLLKQRLKRFDFKFLSTLKGRDIYKALTKPTGLHIYNEDMSYYIFSGIQRIKETYKSNAANIWNDKPSSSLLVYRFLQFEGIGNKIATMAANILVRDFKIKVRDKYSIDISVDVHTRRVFKRLGFVNKDASNEEIIYKARSLHPEYPGVFDLSCWQIGREWCNSRKPNCHECYMNELCPKIGVN